MRRFKQSAPRATGRRHVTLIAAVVLSTLGACGHQDQIRDPAAQAAASKAGVGMVVMAEKARHAAGQVFAKAPVGATRDPGLRGPLVTHAPARRVDAAFLLARLHKLKRAGLGGNGPAAGKDTPVAGPGLLPPNPR